MVEPEMCCGAQIDCNAEGRRGTSAQLRDFSQRNANGLESGASPKPFRIDSLVRQFHRAALAIPKKVTRRRM
jgi:hypothetical protein